MKIATLFWIIGILSGILAIIGWILNISEKSATRKKIGESIFDFSWRFILILYIVSYLGTSNRRFFIFEYQNLWEEYNLPQIDNMMPLMVFNNKHVYFESISKDSIRHDRKSIDYDIFDVFTITDRFKNEKENKSLTINFIKPNIIRDSSRVIILTHYDGREQIIFDTLSNYQGDSVLNSWGLMSKTYTKLMK